eukprot:575229-Prymnesium_polylepis.1
MAEWAARRVATLGASLVVRPRPCVCDRRTWRTVGSLTERILGTRCEYIMGNVRYVGQRSDVCVCYGSTGQRTRTGHA